MLSLERFNGVTWEMLTVSLGKFSFAPKPMLFELFSFVTSVCQCYMNMWNIKQVLTTLMDNVIKLKQWLDKLIKQSKEAGMFLIDHDIQWIKLLSY